MLENFQDIFFVFNVVNMFRLDDLVLFHSFNRVLFAWVAFQPSNLNISKRTYNMSSGIPSPSDSPNTQSSGLILLKARIFFVSI